MVYIDEAHYDYDQYHNVDKIIRFLPLSIGRDRTICVDLIAGLREYDLQEVKDEDGKVQKLVGENNTARVEITKAFLDNNEAQVTVSSLDDVTKEYTFATFTTATTSKNDRIIAKFFGLHINEDGTVDVIKQTIANHDEKVDYPIIDQYYLSHLTYDEKMMGAMSLTYDKGMDLEEYWKALHKSPLLPIASQEIKATCTGQSRKHILEPTSCEYDVTVNKNTTFSISTYSKDALHDLNELTFADKPVIYYK